MQTVIICNTYRFKIKIGSDLNEDISRATIFRDEIGWDNFLVNFRLLWGPLLPHAVLSQVFIYKTVVLSMSSSYFLFVC